MKYDVKNGLSLPPRNYHTGAHYGACKFLHPSRFLENFTWAHGWCPTWFDKFSGEGIGCVSPSCVYGVASVRQKQLIESVNSRAVLIGLPFAYELYNCRTQLTRIDNSCLYMPPHVTHFTEFEYTAHFDVIERLFAKFSHVTVCLHWMAYRESSVRTFYEDRGCTVIEGANNFDANSLSRMLAIFRQHTTLVADYYGSHIAYAAASGMNVLFSDENLTRLNLDMQGFSAVDARDYRRLTSLEVIKYNMESHINNGGTLITWGLNEIGYDYVDLKVSNKLILGNLPDFARFKLNKLYTRISKRKKMPSSQVWLTHLVEYVRGHSRCGQLITVFDQDLYDGLGTFAITARFCQSDKSRTCACANVLDNSVDLDECGTIVTEYCKLCLQDIIEFKLKSQSHCRFVLYCKARSYEVITDLVPKALNVSLYNIRALPLPVEHQEPAVPYLLIFSCN